MHMQGLLTAPILIIPKTCTENAHIGVTRRQTTDQDTHRNS